MRKKGNGDMAPKTLYVLIAVLLLVLIGGGAYGYNKYDDLKQENARLSDPEEAAKAEGERIKARVAELIDVPADETPIIATVTDTEKLKGQAFYSKAQNGDKALFYQQAKRAVLYRPSTDKIIETAPLDIKQNESTDKNTEPSGTSSSSQNTGDSEEDSSSDTSDSPALP